MFSVASTRLVCSAFLLFFFYVPLTYAMERTRAVPVSGILTDEQVKVIMSNPTEFPEQYATLMRTKYIPRVVPILEIKQPDVSQNPQTPPPSDSRSERNFQDLARATAQQAYGQFRQSRADQVRRNRLAQFARAVVTCDEHLVKIFNDSNAQMVNQVHTALGLLQQCKNGIGTVDGLQALLSLSRVDACLSSYEYNEAFQHALVCLYLLCYNSDGSINLNLEKATFQKGIDTIIEDFKADIGQRSTEHENDLMISITNRVYNRPNPDRGVSDMRSSAQSLQRIIANQTLTRDLQELTIVCFNGDWEKAHALVDRYDGLQHGNVKARADRKLIKDVYSHYARSAFNEYGIAHAYAADPYIKTLNLEETDLPRREINTMLEERHRLYLSVVDQFSLENLTQKAQAVAYSLVDVAGQPAKAVADRLARELSKDSADPEIQAAYDAFYESNGLPKGYTYNSAALSGFTIPESIGTQRHAFERALLFRLVHHNGQNIEAARNGIAHVIAACNDGPHVQAYRSLALSTTRALLNETVDATILQSHNFAAKGKDGNPLLSGAGIEFVARAAAELQNSELSEVDKDSLRASLLGLDMLCKTALERGTQLPDSVWRSLDPLIGSSAKIDSELLEKMGADKARVIASLAREAAEYAKHSFRIETAVREFKGKGNLESPLELRFQPHESQEIIEKCQIDIRDSDAPSALKYLHMIEFGGVHKLLSLEIGARSFVKDPWGTIKHLSRDVANGLLMATQLIKENGPFIDWSFLYTDGVTFHVPEKPVTQALIDSLAKFFHETPINEQINTVVSLGVDLLLQKYLVQAAAGLLKSGMLSELQLNGAMLGELTADWEATKQGRLFPLTNFEIHKASTVMAAEAQMRIEELIAHGGNKEIWSKIQPTQPMWPGTNIPKSFNVKINGRNVHITANATKRFAEVLSDPTRNTLEMEEKLLGKLCKSLEEVEKAGHFDGELIHASQRKEIQAPLLQAGDWKVSLSAPPFAGGYPKVHHLETWYRG